MTHYARAPRLFADLELAHGDGRFARLFRMLTKANLLILDDWGPDRLNSNQRRDLMEIVEDRYGAGSTLINTTGPVVEMTDATDTKPGQGGQKMTSSPTAHLKLDRNHEY